MALGRMGARGGFGSLGSTGGKRAAAVTFATWDSANKTSILTLSGGNLVASGPGGFAGNAYGKATLSSSAKFFFSVVRTSGDQGIGVSDASWLVGGATFFGGDNHAICWYYADTNSPNTTFYNGISVGPVQTVPSVGSVIDVACDPVGKLIWFRVDGGSWNNTGGANPATGVSGISIASMSAPMFPTTEAGTGTAAGVQTANFGATAYSFAAPSGYASLFS